MPKPSARTAAALTSSILLGGVLLLSPWWLGASATAADPIQSRPAGGERGDPAPARDPTPLVAAVQVARDDEAGTRELAQLTAMLTDWSERVLWPHLKQPDANPFSIAIPDDPTPEISSRLASFSTRFGLGFRDCPGWQSFSEAAGRAYERLVTRFPAPLPGASAEFGDPWTAPAWLSVRSLLLEVTGRKEEARTLLFGEAQRYWAGCCWMCLSESLYYLAKARAEFLDRQGDAHGALLWLHEAYDQAIVEQHGDLFGKPCRALEIMASRYVVLLAEAGEFAAATSVQRALAKTSPDSQWTALARLAIGQHGPIDETSSVEVFGVPLCDGSDGDTYGSGLAFIVADRAASTWHVLAVRIPKFPDRQVGSRLLPDLGTDLEVVEPTDPRVLPLLQRCLAQADGWKWSRALLVLHALGQASRQTLIECLEWMTVDGSLPQGSGAGAAIDEAARAVAGGGPTLSQPLDRITLRDLRTAWLEWLR